MVNISLFSPPEGDYTSRAAELARQKKLADMLIEMSQQEMPVSTAGGITAPVSPYGALAKALTSFGGSYLSGKAAEDEAALKKEARKEASAALSDLYQPAKTATLPGQEFTLTGPSKEKPLISALKMGDINYNLPATSYEDQQRMLDEYEMSDNPYIAQLAATQRPRIEAERERIEAERERTMPKYMAGSEYGVYDVNPNSPNFGKPIVNPTPKTDKLPSSVEEAQWLATASPAEKAAWIAAKNAGRSVTNVNVGPTGIDYGKPEEGLVWARNPNGTIRLDDRGAPIAIPYQGGKAFISNEEKTGKKQEVQRQQDLATSIVRDDIRRAKDYIKISEIPVTGLAGAMGKNIPGTPANALNAILSGIQANISFDKLQQMRQASPTGGALGNVSDKDLELIKSVYGSLLQSTNEKDLLYNLDRLDKTVYKVVNGADAPPPQVRPPLSTFGGRGR